MSNDMGVDMRLIKAKTILLVLAVLASCSGSYKTNVTKLPDDWQLIKAGDKFTFRAPSDLRPSNVKGIDSFVGEYKSPTLVLSFDYGWYSNSLNDEGYSGSWTSIDGRRAWIATKDDNTGVHFPRVDDADEKTKLTMFAKLKGSSIETVHKIFRSIEFSNNSERE